MGIIKRADLETYTREPIAMDLGDLEKRGRAVVDAAQEEASRIIKDAQEERDRLLSDATQVGEAKGFENGSERGFNEGSEQGKQQAIDDLGQELTKLNEQWSATLLQWEQDREEFMQAARTEVIALAAQIAARVIKRTIDLDPEVVADQLEAVLESLVTPTDIRVRVHPADLDLLARVMPAMIEQCASCNHAELVEDSKIDQGSCIVSTKGGGQIDASIQTQLDRIVATLLPAHRGPDYDQHLQEQPNTDNNDSKDNAA